MKVAEQGAVVVTDNRWFISNDDKVKILEVDLHSKYCQVDAYYGDLELVLGANEYSCHLKEDVNRDAMTIIKFDKKEFKGFKIYLASISRYTLQIIFINKTLTEV